MEPVDTRVNSVVVQVVRLLLSARSPRARGKTLEFLKTGSLVLNTCWFPSRLAKEGVTLRRLDRRGEIRPRARSSASLFLFTRKRVFPQPDRRREEQTPAWSRCLVVRKRSDHRRTFLPCGMACGKEEEAEVGPLTDFGLLRKSAAR